MGNPGGRRNKAALRLIPQADSLRILGPNESTVRTEGHVGRVRSRALEGQTELAISQPPKLDGAVIARTGQMNACEIKGDAAYFRPVFHRAYQLATGEFP